MADKIFINYRRDDSIGMAGRLHDRLAQVFGPDNIFMDVDNIPVGEDFVAHLNSQVTACDIVVAVIGRTWLKAKDKRGQLRLHQPDDWVAIELAAALTRNIRVIPILVDGARMPRESELPESLRPLARRQAAEVRHAHFGKDAEALIGRMRELIARQKEEQKQAEAETRQQADEEAQRLEAKRRGEEEAQRRQLEALAREVEAKRLADEEANRKRAEVEAKRRAEEEARRRLEMEARRRAEEERWKPAEIKRRAEQGQAVAIKPHKVWDWLLATRADRWFLALAVLLLIGWSGYGFFRHAVERGEQQAALKWDQERTAAMADANRKVEEAEQQRIAAVQAVERERQARESSEAKQKAEAERQRLAPESKPNQPRLGSGAIGDNPKPITTLTLRLPQEGQTTAAADEAKRKAEGPFPNMENQTLCMWALDGPKSGWEQERRYGLHISEASRRGLTVDSCRQLVGATAALSTTTASSGSSRSKGVWKLGSLAQLTHSTVCLLNSASKSVRNSRNAMYLLCMFQERSVIYTNVLS